MKLSSFFLSVLLLGTAAQTAQGLPPLGRILAKLKNVDSETIETISAITGMVSMAALCGVNKYIKPSPRTQDILYPPLILCSLFCGVTCYIIDALHGGPLRYMNREK